jgi:uncharacterized protein
MRRRLALAALALPCPAFAAPCPTGAYVAPDGDFVVLGAATAAGQRFLFRDGRRGDTAAADAPVGCDGGAARLADGRRWPRLATRETDMSFTSAGTRLAGRLVEPPGADPSRPLVVLVHGSEKTAAIGTVYAWSLAAQGIAVLAYDKRGTGRSDGDYTQNFELLADDAAAALAAARGAAAGRFGRAGFFGGSQGGWVAPLAATRSAADFVAVGFGLVASPIAEDRDQLLDEADRLRLGPAERRQVERLSDATAAIVRSHFARGFGQLEALRREVGHARWAATIGGEYSGAMLRMADADLRRIGRARFDAIALIWDYDAPAALRRLRVPLLWVLAGEDREAPVAATRAALLALPATQRADVWLFPATDHGMVEYRENPDGTRAPTRITEGYLRLVADWIKGGATATYGRAQRLR